jgi:CheY-like chemotaxis protein
MGLESSTSDCSLIVIVDDNKLIRETTINLIKLVLAEMNIIDNYRTIECVDGIDLLKLIISDTEHRIKCVFTDENMEYLNGSEAVKIIRRLEEKGKVYKYNIITITAFDDIQTKKNILSSGVNSMLTKPCTKSSMIKILKELNL